MQDEPMARRAALGAMGVAGLAAAAACSTYSSNSGTPAKPQAGGVLGATTDVPVGGGAVFKDQQVVVTQPSAGQFAAFSAVCTHQGCTVDTVKDGTIDCPCHGSKFKIADGSVAQGPANRPLEKKAITVSGGKITLA